jgi:transcriptional regulator with XRE-family HTH domain
MTEVRRKARIAMLEKRLSFADLEQLTGLAKGSIHNLLSGVSKSPRGRQLLTNALGGDLWPGISVTERTFIFMAGTELEFTDESAAEECERQFGDAVQRHEKVVVFLRNFSAVIPAIGNEGLGGNLVKVRCHAEGAEIGAH